MDGVREDAIASKLAPTLVLCCAEVLGSDTKTCGSELARDGGGSG